MSAAAPVTQRRSKRKVFGRPANLEMDERLLLDDDGDEDGGDFTDDVEEGMGLNDEEDSDFDDDSDGPFAEDGQIERELTEREEELKFCYERLKQLENRLQLKFLAPQERESLEAEVLDIRNELDKRRNEIRALKRQNLRNLMTVVMILVFTLFCYCLYWFLSTALS